ncbi:MAG: ribosomal protein S18-alanine N-acetyltransferase [Halioglobus sp.]|nr:ribosomal protein S18-alanine N-acetyltransferase [Halioglobus sp.]
MSALFEIRRARREDIEVLVGIDAANPAAWSEGHFARAIGGGSTDEKTVLVAQDAGLLLGFIVYAQVLDEVSIHNIAVRAAQWGQGVGGGLLGAALARMKSAGAVRCLLEVRRSNAVARHLYMSAGFLLDGERKNYYRSSGISESALLMSRTL